MRIVLAVSSVAILAAAACGKKEEAHPSPVPSKPAQPPENRVKAKGFSIAIASGWGVEKAKDQKDSELLIREDKRDTETHVAGGVFVSRGPAKVAMNADECANKGQNMEHPPAKLRSTHWGTTPLGPTCFIELNDDRMVINSQSVGVGNGEAVIFNCYHDLNDPGPSPACAEMFASIKLE